jgi:hypothetical protein
MVQEDAVSCARRHFCAQQLTSQLHAGGWILLAGQNPGANAPQLAAIREAAAVLAWGLFSVQGQGASAAGQAGDGLSGEAQQCHCSAESGRQRYGLPIQ